MLIRNKMFTKDIQEIKRKGSECNTIESHQHKGKLSTRIKTRKEKKNNQKAINKMVKMTYLCIIVLNADGLMLQSIDMG